MKYYVITSHALEYKAVVDELSKNPENELLNTETNFRSIKDFLITMAKIKEADKVYVTPRSNKTRTLLEKQFAEWYGKVLEEWGFENDPVE